MQQTGCYLQAATTHQLHQPYDAFTKNIYGILYSARTINELYSQHAALQNTSQPARKAQRLDNHAATTINMTTETATVTDTLGNQPPQRLSKKRRAAEQSAAAFNIIARDKMYINTDLDAHNPQDWDQIKTAEFWTKHTMHHAGQTTKRRPGRPPKENINTLITDASQGWENYRTQVFAGKNVTNELNITNNEKINDHGAI